MSAERPDPSVPTWHFAATVQQVLVWTGVVLFSLGFVVAAQFLTSRHLWWYEQLLEPEPGRALVEASEAESSTRLSYYTVSLKGEGETRDYVRSRASGSLSAATSVARVYSLTKDKVGETVSVSWLSPPIGPPYLLSVDGKKVTREPYMPAFVWFGLTVFPLLLLALMIGVNLWALTPTGRRTVARRRGFQ